MGGGSSRRSAGVKGFVNLSEIHGETRDPWDRQPPAFGRLLSGRDVQAGKNQLKLTVT